jgi:hypothetical protein
MNVLADDISLTLWPSGIIHKRIDRIVAAKSDGTLRVLMGWGSPFPEPPELPENVTLLADVTVQPGVICITNNDIRNYGGNNGEGSSSADWPGDD